MKPHKKQLQQLKIDNGIKPCNHNIIVFQNLSKLTNYMEGFPNGHKEHFKMFEQWWFSAYYVQ
jgi:hypothetical protein